MHRMEVSKFSLSVAVMATLLQVSLSFAILVRPTEAFRTNFHLQERQWRQRQQQLQRRQHTISTLLMARPKSKWDLLEDEDDEDDDVSGPKIPIANDMKYVERNVRRAHENFLNLRNIGGKDICNDVYAKSPLAKEEVWYVGKVAKISEVSLEDCIARQWNLIETHATNLRPIELYPHRGNLELWTAPGDTELDVAYNRPELKMTKMEHYEVTPQELKNNLIGFQGEVYQEGEEGFRSWRKEDGSPARPEINPGGETRPPTEAEMDQLRTEMERQNISVEDIYKAQQEKENKEA